MLHRTRTWAHFALTFIVIVVILTTSVVFAQDAKPEPVGLRPDAPQYALHGPYWVGVREFTIPDKEGKHLLPVTVWYPALNLTGAAKTTRDAAPDNEHGSYPLVIYAHGWTDNRLASTFLTEHLASWGFVVMASSYADHWTGFGPDYSLFTRPQDVSMQIDYAVSLTASGESLEGMIDTERVAVVGHSLGGETALLAAGARLDSGPNSWCAEYADLALPSELLGSVIICPSAAHPDLLNQAGKSDVTMASLASLEAVPDGLWPSWGDLRVDAIVPLAPASVHVGPESFEGITVPTMVMVGSKDRYVFSDLPLYIPYFYQNLNSSMKSLVVFDEADHLIFRDSFYDPIWDTDRAHDLTNHFTTAFLLDVLKGDKDAHAALLAENVSFPGITYETTMK